ncbi:MAG: GYF domain-containing protein, partial [Acidobacteria bacterium]|nr:GYF domain-containing protein [Acidobacteriota bacterium]
MSYWYLAINNKSEGPLTADEVGTRIRGNQVTPQTLAFTQGMADWTPLNQVPQFHSMFRSETLSMPPVPTRTTGLLRSHEIDYEVFGDDMQFVEITLDPQEAVIAEAGGMMYMTQGVQMATQFGDGSQPSSGFFDKVLSAG